MKPDHETIKKVATYRRGLLRRSKGFMRGWVEYVSNPTVEKAHQLSDRWGPYRYPPCLKLHDQASRLFLREQAYRLKQITDDLVLGGDFPRLEWDYWVSENGHVLKPLELSNSDKVYFNYHFQFSKIQEGKDQKLPFYELRRNNIPKEVSVKFVNFAEYVKAEAGEKAGYRHKWLGIIKEQLVAWEDASKKLGLHSQLRRQHDLFPKYLEVWDLVEEKGERWTEIAKIVYPKDFINGSELVDSEDDVPEPNPESAKEKVQQHYKAVCRDIASVERPNWMPE